VGGRRTKSISVRGSTEGNRRHEGQRAEWSRDHQQRFFISPQINYQLRKDRSKGKKIWKINARRRTFIIADKTLLGTMGGVPRTPSIAHKNPMRSREKQNSKFVHEGKRVVSDRVSRNDQKTSVEEPYGCGNNKRIVHVTDCSYKGKDEEPVIASLAIRPDGPLRNQPKQSGDEGAKLTKFWG